MKLKLKQILVREGLVVLGLWFFSSIIIVLTFWFPLLYLKTHKYSNTHEIVEAANSISPPFAMIRDVAIALLFLGYPLYWLVRLILFLFKSLHRRLLPGK